MDRLIRGYRDFMARRWPEQQARYAELSKKGQRPDYLVIACSDSRSDPATIFGAGPGELFVIRNVAAIVPPYEEGGGYHGTSSAIAFAVLQLEVKYIVVMGHAQCGGVAAARDMKAAADTPFLGSWIELLEPAAQKCRHRDQPDFERETVKLSLERLMTFPFIAERVNAKSLSLVGMRFGIADGKLELLDAASGTFEIVSPD
jgi:carbonic anhydrase